MNDALSFPCAKSHEMAQAEPHRLASPFLSKTLGGSLSLMKMAF